MNKALAYLCMGIWIAVSGAAEAAVVHSIGAGSAVSIIEASADFDATSSLNGNPYLEDGMSFSRTGLTFNNNGCGYAGCSGHAAFSHFSGNYMYGVGNGGYFDIAATGPEDFTALEFAVGTGNGFPIYVAWEATKSGFVVGSGTFQVISNNVIGFSDAAGFDNLRFTNSTSSGVNFLNSFNAPAFDTVKAQFGGVAPVPVPGTLLLLGVGLLGIAARRRTG